MTTPTPEMKPLKPCAVLDAVNRTASSSGSLGNAFRLLCDNCPNRAPSPVEAELRECLQAVVHAYYDDCRNNYHVMEKAERLLAKLDASEKEAGSERT